LFKKEGEALELCNCVQIPGMGKKFNECSADTLRCVPCNDLRTLIASNVCQATVDLLETEGETCDWYDLWTGVVAVNRMVHLLLKIFISASVQLGNPLECRKVDFKMV
jgi:hypothetical protein